MMKYYINTINTDMSSSRMPAQSQAVMQIPHMQFVNLTNHGVSPFQNPLAHN